VDATVQSDVTQVLSFLNQCSTIRDAQVSARQTRVLRSAVLSVNTLTLLGLSAKPLTYIKNNVGPRTDP
jgi:hypothetical protein